MTAIKDFFCGGVGQKEVMAYLSTYNMATQAVAVDGTNIYNVQTTGGGACSINGVLIPALAADAELLLATEETNCDILDLTLADDYEMWFAFFVTAAGTLSVKQASAAAAISGSLTAPTIGPTIPYFDPATYCCVALALYSNDAASATVTFGTVAGGTDWGTDGQFVQMIGPVFPDPANILNKVG